MESIDGLEMAESEDAEYELALARARIKELQALVETDPLLNIYNRRGFERVLERGLSYVSRYQTSAALVFIDLDKFKSINDKFGHLAGDKVLQAVAAAISRHIRGSDIVGRFGGDEFTVLLWNLNEATARAKAQSFEHIIADLHIPHGREVLYIGATTGIAVLQSLDSLSELVGRADMDMFARKRQRAPLTAGPQPCARTLNVRHLPDFRAGQDASSQGISAICAP